MTTHVKSTDVSSPAPITSTELIHHTQSMEFIGAFEENRQTFDTWVKLCVDNLINQYGLLAIVSVSDVVFVDNTASVIIAYTAHVEDVA